MTNTIQIILFLFTLSFFGLAKYSAIKREAKNNRHTGGLKSWETRQKNYQTVLIKEGDRVVDRLSIRRTK